MVKCFQEMMPGHRYSLSGLVCVTIEEKYFPSFDKI